MSQMLFESVTHHKHILNMPQEAFFFLQLSIFSETHSWVLEPQIMVRLSIERPPGYQLPETEQPATLSHM